MRAGVPLVFDVDAAVSHLGGLAQAPLPVPVGGWPQGSCDTDFLRSPAACVTGRLAAEQGLFLFHYEHRVQLPLPQDWVPPHDPELALPGGWAAGVLLERKYHSFRHDQASGGFNPGHRSKWTTHELCHGLVGFGWQRDASPLFLATAGRLAELIPVVLYYFLDEAHLRRCPTHQGQWALYRRFCADCERVASTVDDDAQAHDKLQAAARFIDRELAAVARTRRLGRPVPHLHGSLDLCSDGLAYAAAHGDRLRSKAFASFADEFLVEGGGWSTHLDDLEARAIAVVRSITTGAALPNLAPSASHGRSRWMLQDVGWRLRCVWHETDGDCADELERIIVRLGIAVGGTCAVGAEAHRMACGAVLDAIEAYQQLEEEWVLPAAEEVFSVGFPLGGGHGSSASQVTEGVESALPLTSRLLAHDLSEHTGALIRHEDPWRREPLPSRMSQFLDDRVDGAVADLARYEAAVATLPAHDGEAAALGPGGVDDRVRLAPSARVLFFGCDVQAVARDADFGDLLIEANTGRLLDVDGHAPPAEPTALVLLRNVRGEVDAAVLHVGTGEALLALGDGAELILPGDERQALLDLRVLLPASWGSPDTHPTNP